MQVQNSAWRPIGTMNTTIDNDTTKLAPRNGVNGRNGSHNGRVAVQQLTILRDGPAPAALVPAPPLHLPVPVFPRHPEKLGYVEPDPKFLPQDGNPYRTRVTAPMVARA